MKQISPVVYESLSPKARVIAAIEAEARCDEAEKRRLIKTCPKKTYLQTDLEFSEPMEKLIGLAMAVESDLRDCVIGFLIAVRSDPKNSRKFLQNFANIRESWKSTVIDMGIDEKSMALAGPPTSPFFEFIEDIVPKPNRAKSKKLADEMLKIINPR